MVLCNPFRNISFTVKKTTRKQNTNHNYLAIKNYIVQYKLQYGKNKRE